MLTYNELVDICEQKRVTITEVAKNSLMTLSGFRNAMRKSALTADKIELVCNYLGMTPNEFFKVKTFAGDNLCNKYGQNQTINQVPKEIDQTIEILREQLKEKDTQISVKDEQINNLISKLK